ncbi:hypothetical protein KGF57_004042 [Candida theae]|uniref:Uncharacterized protein n=1 Tax=Candida theae TaxID=1198502 RepID=A0AAD5BBX3_9ASCO|nr:uncharacterized protein KGF57_004042 [Candida theae]KAI5953050.1 hypothetical protein KGF57_004042 [Candida theae]
MDSHHLLPGYASRESRLDSIMAKQQHQYFNGRTKVDVSADETDLQPNNSENDIDIDIDDNGQGHTINKPDAATINMYSQLRQLYNEENFNEIMFLLPEVSQLNTVPPIFHLIIGCTMTHFGRLQSAFREIGVSICLATNDSDRKEFIKVLAYTYADLNDQDSAMGCLGEVLDMSRGILLNTKQFDEMKLEICQLEKDLLLKLEQSKSSKNPTNSKSKSFEDQVLDLIALNKTFPKTSFTGKCQIIIQKLNHAEILLQKWDKERDPLLKHNPLKLMLDAIFVLGPSIAYYGMLKLEPIMNQYFEFIENNSKVGKSPKSRAVSSFFFLGGLNPVRGNSGRGGGGGGGRGGVPGSDNSGYYVPYSPSATNCMASAQQVKIIKGFIAMLRHKYKEAYELFHEAQDENAEIYNHVLTLKYICRSNIPQLSRRELEVLGDKINKLPFVSTFKFFTLATIYQNLYLLQQAGSSRHRRRSSMTSGPAPNYYNLSMKHFISAAAYAQDDDLYVTSHYDNILNFLINAGKGYFGSDDEGGSKIDKKQIPTLAFFYQVRNYFCLKSDYNYLHIPNLVGDWQEIKTNTELKSQIEKFLDSDADELTNGVENSHSHSKTHKGDGKSFDMIKFWEKEYLKFKGTMPDTIKQYLKKT